MTSLGNIWKDTLKTLKTCEVCSDANGSIWSLEYVETHSADLLVMTGVTYHHEAGHEDWEPHLHMVY